jgi:transcriptional regulator with GAF, ATPase, and Fis domain
VARDRPHTEATLDPSRPLAASADSVGAGRHGVLYETGRQLLEQRDPRQVLATIQRAILTHLEPDRAAVLSLEAEGAFRPVTTHGLELSGPEDLWPVSFSVIRQVVESGLSVLASDARSDPQFEDAESIQRFRIRSILCVPLGRPARGVVYLDNRSARPFQPSDLEFLTALGVYAALALERAAELARASEALAQSADRLDVLQGELLRHRIVGSAPTLLSAYDALRRFAKSGARVLLRGETGTGKELFARAYAAESGRAAAAYVPVPIPALAPGLVESELFGHVRGAFTEATRDKKGRLEVAHGGVLFLDEIGDIEPALQVKLLRFLDSGELFRVGDNDARRVDALVVSATNRPLEKDVEQGRFRADLLARLGHAIRIPPLRERAQDVPELVAHFLEAYDRGTPRKAFAPETLAVLQRHRWPFNVRELQQVVESAVCLVDSDVIRPEHLPEYLRREAAASPTSVPAAGPPGPMRKAVEEAERAAIVRALEFTAGNRRKAIDLLQVSPETFYKRLEEFGLK